MSYERRQAQLQQLLAELESDDEEVEAIYIEPPDPHIYSDEDSADEDEGGLLDNLSSRQLMAGAEVVIRRRRPAQDDSDEETMEEEGLDQNLEVEDSVDSTKNNMWSKMKKVDFSTWRKGDIIPTVFPDFPAPDFSKYSELSPVEIFELFFTDELLKTLIAETEKYALFKTLPSPEISLDEMRTFLGILIFSGYHRLPGERCFWETRSDMRCDLVANAMRRNRYLQIKRFLHFVDNNNFTTTTENKMWKLQPLIDYLGGKFLEHFVPEQKLSFDESMIEYFGRHSCKQFIRGKPVRFGYKVWSLTTVSGYLITFEVYQGKRKGVLSSQARAHLEALYGKNTAPMCDFINLLPKFPYHFFCDNLFTSLQLLFDLQELGYGGTGTLRRNRLPRDFPKLDKKTMMKKEKGFFKETVTDGGLMVVQYKDNGVVIVASNCCGLEPKYFAQRYSAKDKKKVPLPFPNVVSTYNSGMGGVDRMDENISYYRIGIRGKKWWFPIFTWLLDASIQNAWNLKKKTSPKLSHLEFRREIALTYLTRSQTKPKPGRPRTSSTDGRVLNSIRYDGTNHYIVSSNRRRCAGSQCKSFGRTMCEKCDVGLCISCFKTFHTRD